MPVSQRMLLHTLHPGPQFEPTLLSSHEGKLGRGGPAASRNEAEEGLSFPAAPTQHG